jgi:hypothetical protein
MQGRVLDAETGALIGQGEFQLNDDRREGNIACLLKSDYLQANRRRTAIMEEVARVLTTVDVVLFTSLTLDSRTSINPVMSLTGHPSIAVPTGFLSSGSPAGVMFAGPLYRDRDLLAFAKAFERAASPAMKHPAAFGPQP